MDNFDSALPGLKPVLEKLLAEPKKIDHILLRKNFTGSEINELQNLCQKNGIPIQRVDSHVLDKICRRGGLAKGVAHQGVVARLSDVSYVDCATLLPSVANSPLPLILALDEIQDPGNLGTLARTLYALGGVGLLVSEHTARLGPAARKCAAGALEMLPIAKHANFAEALDQLELAGLTIYAAEMKNPKTHNAFTSSLLLPAVLLLGNEAHGIRPHIRKRCHALIHIPQARTFDSLNVAQAGAILMGLMARQHFGH